MTSLHTGETGPDSSEFQGVYLDLEPYFGVIDGGFLVPEPTELTDSQILLLDKLGWPIQPVIQANPDAIWDFDSVESFKNPPIGATEQNKFQNNWYLQFLYSHPRWPKIQLDSYGDSAEDLPAEPELEEALEEGLILQPKTAVERFGIIFPGLHDDITRHVWSLRGEGRMHINGQKFHEDKTIFTKLFVAYKLTRQLVDELDVRRDYPSLEGLEITPDYLTR